MLRIFRSTLLLACICIFACAPTFARHIGQARHQPTQDAQMIPLRPGTIAPDFHVRSLNGPVVSPATFRGHVLLIDMWATWCGPCRAAIPVLERIQERYYNNGLYVLGISVDDPSTAGMLPSFMATHQMRYVVASSPDQVNVLRQAYHSDSIPSLYLIDKHGRVRWSTSGYSEMEEVELNKLIPHLIAEK